MSSLPTEPGRKPSADGLPDPVGTAAFDREVHRLADRYRHLSESRLQARLDPDDPDDPGRTRAGAGLALARELAALGDAPAGQVVPDLGGFAVGDQIAVTGHDLAACLRRHPAEQDAAETAETVETALTAVRALAALV